MNIFWHPNDEGGMAWNDPEIGIEWPELKPDVIHLHSSKAGVIGRVAFNGEIPMFYTPHGYSFLMENYKPMKIR